MILLYAVSILLLLCRYVHVQMPSSSNGNVVVNGAARLLDFLDAVSVRFSKRMDGGTCTRTSLPRSNGYWSSNGISGYSSSKAVVRTTLRRIVSHRMERRKEPWNGSSIEYPIWYTPKNSQATIATVGAVKSPRSFTRANGRENSHTVRLRSEWRA